MTENGKVVCFSAAAGKNQLVGLRETQALTSLVPTGFQVLAGKPAVLMLARRVGKLPGERIRDNTSNIGMNQRRGVVVEVNQGRYPSIESRLKIFSTKEILNHNHRKPKKKKLASS